MLFQPVITTFIRISVTWMLSVLGVIQGGDTSQAVASHLPKKQMVCEPELLVPTEKVPINISRLAQVADVCVSLAVEKVHLKTHLSSVQTNRNWNLPLTSTIICWRELRC